MPVATVAGTPPSPFTASAGVKPWPTPRVGEGVMEGEARREREAVGEGVGVFVGVGVALGVGVGEWLTVGEAEGVG